MNQSANANSILSNLNAALGCCEWNEWRDDEFPVKPLPSTSVIARLFKSKRRFIQSWLFFKALHLDFMSTERNFSHSGPTFQLLLPTLTSNALLSSQLSKPEIWKKVFLHPRSCQACYFPSKRKLFETKIFNSVLGVFFLFLILPMTRRLRIFRILHRSTIGVSCIIQICRCQRG